MSDTSRVSRAKRYVLQQRERGHSDEEIKWSLIEIGWTKDSVSSLWEELPQSEGGHDDGGGQREGNHSLDGGQIAGDTSATDDSWSLPDETSDGPSDDDLIETTSVEEPAAASEPVHDTSEERLLGECVAWHGKTSSLGQGTLRLTSKRLTFSPQRLFKSRDPIDLPMSDIVGVREKKAPTAAKILTGGLLLGANSQLLVREQSGKMHLFVLHGADCRGMAAKIRHQLDRVKAGQGVSGQSAATSASRPAYAPKPHTDNALKTVGVIFAIVVLWGGIGLMAHIYRDPVDTDEESPEVHYSAPITPDAPQVDEGLLKGHLRVAVKWDPILGKSGGYAVRSVTRTNSGGYDYIGIVDHYQASATSKWGHRPGVDGSDGWEFLDATSYRGF